jgi:hypothetical protein
MKNRITPSNDPSPKKKKTKTPKLNLLVSLNESVEGKAGDGLYRDRQGRLYRGTLPDHKGGQPQDAVPVTVREALEWYVKNEPASNHGSGSMTPVIEMVLKQGVRPPYEPYKNERSAFEGWLKFFRKEVDDPSERVKMAAILFEVTSVIIAENEVDKLKDPWVKCAEQKNN